VRARSRKFAEHVAAVLQQVLDAVMAIKHESCPSVDLRCLVLSERQIRSNAADVRGWRADEIWPRDTVSADVSRRKDTKAQDSFTDPVSCTGIERRERGVAVSAELGRPPRPRREGHQAQQQRPSPCKKQPAVRVRVCG
jgi:hypothetical protein